MAIDLTLCICAKPTGAADPRRAQRAYHGCRDRITRVDKASAAAAVKTLA